MFLRFYICVQMLSLPEKGHSSTFTEKELLKEMKATEISEEDYKVLEDRLKNQVFKNGTYLWHITLTYSMYYLQKYIF